MPLLDERGCRVVPQVPHQSQDLVGDGAHLKGDVPLPAGFPLSIFKLAEVAIVKKKSGTRFND